MIQLKTLVERIPGGSILVVFPDGAIRFAKSINEAARLNAGWLMENMAGKSVSLRMIEWRGFAVVELNAALQEKESV